MSVQTVFGAERFVPTRCPQPKCGNEFRKIGDGVGAFHIGTFWLHKSLQASKAILDSITYPGLPKDIVICGKCNAATLRVRIEELICEHHEDVEAAVKIGFVDTGAAQRDGKPIRGTLIIHSFNASRSRPKRFIA